MLCQPPLPEKQAKIFIFLSKPQVILLKQAFALVLVVATVLMPLLVQTSGDAQVSATRLYSI